MARRPSEADIRFFYRHGGYGAPVGASKSEQEKAHRASATALARAEQEAERRGWDVTWEDDPEGWEDLGEIPEEEVREVLWAALRDEDGNVLASLGSIVNPDRSYGRVVEAELALEALEGGYTSNPTPDFEAALEQWLTAAQEIVSREYGEDFPTGVPQLKLMEGKRYIRVVREDLSSRSAYAFIDKHNGDVLKTAGWKGPAKHARGNIFTGPLGVGPYGATYLRNELASNPRRRRPLRGSPVPGRIYSIGMGGLSELGGEGVNIEPKGTYYLGASSSPKQIVVTRVTPTTIYYETSPWGGEEIRIDRRIGGDLIEQGSRTWIESYGRHADEAEWIARRKAGLESALAGGPPEKVNVEDYRPVRVLARATRKKSEYPRGDPWYGAEEYGNVGGIEEAGETLYDIATSKGDARALKRDKRFKVLSVEPRPVRGD